MKLTLSSLIKAAWVFIALYPATSSAQSICNPAKNITTIPSAPVNNESPSLVNYFDWTQAGFSIRSQNFPTLTSIESPFYQSWNSNMTPFVLTKDCNPADGWELIKMDLGYDQNNAPTIHTTYNPKLLLYNKYTSTLRVFLARGDNSSPQNNVQIALTFNSLKYKTDALNLSQGAVALDVPYSPKTFNTVMALSNTPYLWMYADFPILYDPCTCFYNSLMNIDVKYINTAQMSLSGSSTGTIASINSGSGTVTTPSNNSLSFADPLGATEKIYKSFKSVSNFITEQKAAVQSNLFLTQAAKDEVKNTLDNLSTDLPLFKFLQSSLSNVPYLGLALGVIDYFVGGGAKSGGPTKVQLMPASIDMTTKLDGTISNTISVESFDITTPGSNINNMDASLFPLYNQTMGILNLLETPTVTKKSWSDCGENLNTTSVYRVKTPIKYVLNPAAKLRINSVQAALVLEGPTAHGDYDVNDQPALYSWKYEGPRAVKINNQNYTYHSFRTEYVDAHCIDNAIIMYAHDADWQSHTVDVQNAYIKLLVDFERLDADPNTQHVLQVYKFPAKFDAHRFTAGCGGERDCYDPYGDCLAENPSNCATDMFVPATTTEQSTYCNSSNYSNSRAPRLNNRPQVVKDSISDVADGSHKDYVTIFPNPARTQLYYRGVFNDLTASRIEIINASGITVYSSSQNVVKGPFNGEINIANLPSGTYFFKIYKNATAETQKFVILNK